MGRRGGSSVNSGKISRRLSTALSSAFYEWMLLFMLFIDAIVSYLIKKFAHKCELRTPCLLCSRLDHVLGKEKRKFYLDLVCDNHKLEISSLVYCHAHDKLVDVHGMCESCLFSFATINKSNAETYRLLVGKLGEEFDCDIAEDPSLEDLSTTKHCSCCNEPWTPKGYVKTLMQTRSTVFPDAEFDLPLPVSVEHGHEDKKRSDDVPVSVEATHQKKNRSDPLSDVTYTELKVNSDSESEVTNDDGGDKDARIIQTHHLQRDLVDHHVQPESQTFASSDDFASEKFMDPVSARKPSILISLSDSYIMEPLGTTSMESTDLIGHCLEELNWEQVSDKIEPSISSELISLDDAPLSSKNREASIDVPIEMNLDSLVNDSLLSSPCENPIQGSEDSNLISLDFLSPSPVDNETLVQVPEERKHISIGNVSPSNIVASSVEESKESNKLNYVETPVDNETSVEILEESKHISLDDVSPPNVVASSVEESKESSKLNFVETPVDNESPVEVQEESKHISFDEVSPPSVVASSVEESKESSKLNFVETPVDNETPVEVQEESKHISIDDVSPLNVVASSVEESKESSKLNILETPVDSESLVEVPEESKHIPIDDASPSNIFASSVEESKGSSELNFVETPFDNETPFEVPDESKHIPNDDVSPSNIVASSLEESKGSSELNFVDTSVHNETLLEVPEESKHISVDDASPSNVVSSSVEEAKESSVMGTLEVEKKVEIKCEEISIPTDQPLSIPESPVEENRVGNGTGIQALNSLDLSDAYKLAIGAKGRQLSGLLVEQWIGRDSSKISGDLKVLLSQLSARGMELLMNDASPRIAASPRISINSDDLKASDSSAFNGVEILQRRISLERNESGLSIDGSIVSEIEGENVVDRLKRQVEHDRRLLSAMYKELEEERNASAVATNQAMAMITRLQEEKATLQMEALQHLRMMEEQAEYDMEALENTNNLLAEKEKEIQDLEAELEFYRMKFPNEYMPEDIMMSAYDLETKWDTMDDSKANGIEENASLHTELVTEKPNIGTTVGEIDQSFEDKNHE